MSRLGATDSLSPTTLRTGSHRPASTSTPPHPTDATPVHRLPSTHRATTTGNGRKKGPDPVRTTRSGP